MSSTRPARSVVGMSAEAPRDPNRQCSAPGCTTVLSVYNSDHLCFRHADELTRTRFEDRIHVESRFRYRQVPDPRHLPRAADAG
jgi:hypothetical protein